MDGFMSCIVNGVSGVRLPPETRKHAGEVRSLLTDRTEQQRTPRVSNLYWGVGARSQTGNKRVPKPTVVDLVEEVQTNLV